MPDTEEPARLSDRVAKPGDTDLDIDLSGLRITAVVALGADFIVTLRAGSRRSESTTAPIATDVTFAVPSAPPPVIASYRTQLESWQRRGTWLRLCGARGRYTTMIENPTTFLILPRTT